MGFDSRLDHLPHRRHRKIDDRHTDKDFQYLDVFNKTALSETNPAYPDRDRPL